MVTVFATEAKKRLEAVGYICEWKMVNNVASELFVKDGFRIVSLLVITDGSIDDMQITPLLSDASVKKIKRRR